VSRSAAPRSIEVLAPAKLNLFLEVLGLREDGYHEIVTVTQTVSLFDSIRLTENAAEIELACSGLDVPGGSENLAWRAAEVMSRQDSGRRGVSIKLEKRIPIGAGLGGGSSDAAAVLKGLNELWSLELSIGELEGLAAGLGSDVALFIRGGTAICRGKGEKIEPVRFKHVLHYVVAMPEFGTSTKEVYRKVKSYLTPNVKNVRFLLEQFENAGGPGFAANIGSALFNRLEEVVCASYPRLARLKKRLTDLGCAGALVTGSGSCVYGIAADESSASRIAGELSGEPGLTAVYVARTL